MQEIDIYSLFDSLYRTGHAKLSEHTVNNDKNSKENGHKVSE